MKVEGDNYMPDETEIQIVNTLNGRRNVVVAEDNKITYGELIKSYSLAPPEVVWTVLDEDGNDITDMEVGERECVAHITPGQDIAGGA
ncbi:MAG: hypothetical protein KGY80_08605 [Candidatus Thorarchaeota archaeon]|nr:hypothetical protein [Candidatus Thorarchaeota archaeon]